jgi:hypothetical protein
MSSGHSEILEFTMANLQADPLELGGTMETAVIELALEEAVRNGDFESVVTLIEYVKDMATVYSRLADAGEATLDNMNRRT